MRKEAESLATKYESEIEQIRAEWDKQAKEIPPQPLEIFKRVAETYDGEALAIVAQVSDRTEAYNCGGCFMNVTTEAVNLLMTRDDIIRCPNCTRILVLGSQPE